MASSAPDSDNQHDSYRRASATMTPAIRVVRSLRWRAADIAVGAALGVACGVIFWGFNFAYVWVSPILKAVLPGVASLLHAFWYFSGPLAMLIIRKPGAAVYVNVIGSLTETLFGNRYDLSFVVISALMQSIFTELPFALSRYRKYNLGLSIVSGLLTSLEYGVYLMLFQFQGVAFLSPRGITHMACELIGGVLIAGVMSWFLYRAIAKTGALDHFASGRAVRRV